MEEGKWERRMMRRRRMFSCKHKCGSKTDRQGKIWVWEEEEEEEKVEEEEEEEGEEEADVGLGSI